MRSVALLAGALLALAACGGPAKKTNAADLVPADASSLLHVRTAELPRAAALLARFPARGTVLRAIPRVPPGAGPELDVATLAAGRVFYTQPADEHAFTKRLDAAGRVHTLMRGWTVFAARPALLDAVKHRRANLAERPWYAAALATVPLQAALRELVPGWRAAALTVHGAAAELEVHRLRAPLPQVGSSLAAEVPADAIAAAGVASARSVPRGAPKLLHELATALDGEAVGWVRAGVSLPEVTVVSRPVDAQRALRATARLIARLTKNPASVAATLDGVPMRQVANGAIDLYYGLVHGELIVTDSTAAPGQLGSGTKTLPAVTRLPEATESWLYVNVRAGLPLAKRFAGLFDTRVTRSLETSFAPVRDLLVYASHHDRVATVVNRIDIGSR